jgi:hypothetical protein
MLQLWKLKDCMPIKITYINIFAAQKPSYHLDPSLRSSFKPVSMDCEKDDPTTTYNHIVHAPTIAQRLHAYWPCIHKHL